jgi:hypothetical protein
MALNFPPRLHVPWRLERETIDLAEAAVRLIGPPARRGETRWSWHCPFPDHDDGTPSFYVNLRPVNRWVCYGCHRKGDAAALVMDLRGCTFPEAVAFLTGRASAPRPDPARPRTPGGRVVDRGDTLKKGATPAKARGLLYEAALALVEESAAALWTPPALAALAALRGRGIGDHVLLGAAVGWCPGVTVPKADGGTYRARGTVIPWFDGPRLLLVKVRQPAGVEPKYAEVYRDGAALARAGGLYLTPATIRPGRPVVVAEGELDALVLATALGDGAAVVTLGSASGTPDPATLRRLTPCPRWYIAHDADGAGDKAAAAWTQPRAVRVRPGGANDWSDLAGTSWSGLLALWTDALGIDLYDVAERAAIRAEAEG